jgi:hypothetical protein
LKSHRAAGTQRPHTIAITSTYVWAASSQAAALDGAMPGLSICESACWKQVRI